MRTPIAVIAALLSIGIGVASAQTTDESAIDERVTALFAAVTRGDALAVAASYQENAIHAIGSEVVVGRANLAIAAIQAFAGDNKIPISFTRDAVKLVSSTTAIVHGSYEIRGPIPSSGQAMLTLVKEGNTWLVAGVQLVVKAP
jgi:ketosteroid isomerase-like protein